MKQQHTTANCLRATLLAFAALAALAAVGCGKKSVGCQDYAPSDVTLSWTGFNSASDVTNYFNCHNLTAIAHDGDTLRVRGYLYYGKLQAYYPDYIFDYHHGYINMRHTDCMYLISDTSHYGPWTSAFTLDIRDGKLRQWFYDNFYACLTKEIFAIGTLDQGRIFYFEDSCCDRGVSLITLDIDTIERF